MPSRCIVSLFLALALAGQAFAAEQITRRRTGDFPIAASVSLPPGSSLHFLSGMLADPKSLGDTETQARSVFEKMGAALAAAGLGYGDVVKMNVFLVGDPKLGGKMDFDGFMRAYSQHFGSAAQPNVPARTTVQVAALPMAGALVEIEVVAARAP